MCLLNYIVGQMLSILYLLPSSKFEIYNITLFIMSNKKEYKHQIFQVHIYLYIYEAHIS